MRSFASAGLARTALVSCCSAARGSPARRAVSASSWASGMGWIRRGEKRRNRSTTLPRPSEAVAAVGAEARLPRHRRPAGGTALVRARHVEAAFVAEPATLRRRLAIRAHHGGFGYRSVAAAVCRAASLVLALEANVTRLVVAIRADPRMAARALLVALPGRGHRFLERLRLRFRSRGLDGRAAGAPDLEDDVADRADLGELVEDVAEAAKESRRLPRTIRLEG